MAVVCVSFGFGGGWFVKDWLADREIKSIKDQTNKAIAEAKEESAKIKKDSKDVIEALTARVDALSTDLFQMSKSYEDDLAKAKAQKKIQVVKVPVVVEGKTREVDAMFEGGDLVCNRYPSVFKDQADKMVDRVNQELQK